MQKIQYLSFERKNLKLFECSTFSSPKAPDSFQINIFDLRDDRFFNCGSSNYLSADIVEQSNTLMLLKDIINNSSKSIQVFILPTNIEIFYDQYVGMYHSSKYLKNDINFLSSFLSKFVFMPSGYILGFEPNVTLINNREVLSDFYFKNSECEALTFAKDTNKKTTIKVSNNVFLTFLQINSGEEIIDFLQSINLLSKKEEYPDWLRSIRFDDDEQLIEQNQKHQEKIDSLINSIRNNEAKLENNIYYKSMLIENDDRLVEVVFKTLKEILGIDLSHFKDEKKEDFLFKNNGTTFIGEIKGINSGIGNANISQVDNHKSL